MYPRSNSELMLRLRGAADARALRIQNLDRLHEQLDAFTEQPGKTVRFLSPLDVERKLALFSAIIPSRRLLKRIFVMKAAEDRSCGHSSARWRAVSAQA